MLTQSEIRILKSKLTYANHKITDIQNKIQILETRIDTLYVIMDNLKMLSLRLQPFISEIKQVDLPLITFNILFALPKHLQDTLIALLTNGVSQAQQIADLTGKARAIESNYLNQLYDRGYATKTRKGIKVFYIAKLDPAEDLAAKIREISEQNKLVSST